MPTDTTLQECTQSLTRVQQFDAKTLSREADLGTQLSFSEAVAPAEAIIAVYKRIPLSALPDFSDTQLNVINSQAKSDYNVFKQILDFSATSNESHDVRISILNAIKVRRDQLFDQVWQFVAYGVARITDTSLLETQARATIQTIEDQSAELTAHLTKAKADADAALAAIRAVASEQGVSQQATYFKTEAKDQDALATTWLSYTYKFAAAVGIFAILSMFLHKITWLKPETNAEMLQLITSKFLIFAVLGYLLILAAKNYATHKHNSIINRHRQNALLTYRALVEAAGDKGTEDIILAHAASCIFSPQETGFAQSKGESSSGSKSVLELLTKGASKAGE